MGYEAVVIQTQINNMKPNMGAIQQYKTKLIDLKNKETDFNDTLDKLDKAKQIYEMVKKKRYDEFMEGFNVISMKLKEMYQVCIFIFIY